MSDRISHNQRPGNPLWMRDGFPTESLEISAGDGVDWPIMTTTNNGWHSRKIAGMVVEFSGNDRVVWCEDWSAIWDLAKAGHLRVVHGGRGTYGHADFFMVRQ